MLGINRVVCDKYICGILGFAPGFIRLSDSRPGRERVAQGFYKPGFCCAAPGTGTVPARH